MVVHREIKVRQGRFSTLLHDDIVHGLRLETNRTGALNLDIEEHPFSACYLALERIFKHREYLIGANLCEESEVSKVNSDKDGTTSAHVSSHPDQRSVAPESHNRICALDKLSR
jgi:hypothetical protein